MWPNIFNENRIISAAANTEALWASAPTSWQLDEEELWCCWRAEVSSTSCSVMYSQKQSLLTSMAQTILSHYKGGVSLNPLYLISLSVSQEGQDPCVWLACLRPTVGTLLDSPLYWRVFQLTYSGTRADSITESNPFCAVASTWCTDRLHNSLKL